MPQLEEAQWARATNPAAMMANLLRHNRDAYLDHKPWREKISLRKLRLFTAASFRYLVGRHDPPITILQSRGIEALERLAEDENEGGLYEAWERSGLPKTGIAMGTVAGTGMLAELCCKYTMYDMVEYQCDLLRCLVGNPFSPQRLSLTSQDIACKDCNGTGRMRNVYCGSKLVFEACSVCNGFGKVEGPCPWITAEATQLGELIYVEERFDLMPELADELERAGCDNLELLHHCRGQTRELCSRCGGDGQAHGSDRPFGWSGDGAYGKCVICMGTGFSGDWCAGSSKHSRGCFALDGILRKK